MPRYRSSIPPNAREHIVARYSTGEKRRAEYRVGRKLVGIRSFYDSGEPEHEYGIKDGKRHGLEYDWSGPGTLPSFREIDNAPSRTFPPEVAKHLTR